MRTLTVESNAMAKLQRIRDEELKQLMMSDPLIREANLKEEHWKKRLEDQESREQKKKEESYRDEMGNPLEGSNLHPPAPPPPIYKTRKNLLTTNNSLYNIGNGKMENEMVSNFEQNIKRIPTDEL